MSKCLASRVAIAACVAVAAAGCTQRDPRAISELTPALEPVVHGNNEFAVKLYKAAAATPGNLFFSPFSVSAAFGMTYAGAASSTAQEMRDVLSIQADDAAYHQEFGALIADLGGAHEGRGYELRIANRLFGQKDFAFQKPFLDVTSTDYGAPLERLDFTDPEAARTHVNQWTSDQTEGKIPELFGAGDIDAQTQLVLANAIYFHADWKLQFDPANTQDSSFFLANGETEQVPMMFQDGKFRVNAVDAYSTLEMNYADDELSMVLVIPAESHTLPEVESNLTADALQGMIDGAREEEVSVGLPRFKLDARLPLKDLLEGMGMKNAFDSEAADFSGIADTSAGNLFLQTAVHQAYVQVDEEGTEAAAATGVGVGLTSAPPSLYADHPFLFLIRDRLTSSILFAGRIEDPKELAF